MILADTSAWFLSRRSEAIETRQRFDDLLRARLVASCDMVRFELLHSSRNAVEMAGTSADLDALWDCPVGKPEWSRALEVYAQLGEQGGAHHRSVGHQDLLIAAAAESAGATVLHYDEDFDRIAAITGQPTQWIVPRGSL